MSQRQFFTTVLAVILLGISIAVGVDMLIENLDDAARVQNRGSQTTEPVTTDESVSVNAGISDVTWNSVPHPEQV